MKKFLCAFAAAGLAASATAHESVLPHTHNLSRDHADVFVWSIAGLTLLGLALLLARACQKGQKS